MEDVELEDEDLRAALIELRQYVDVTEEDLKKIFSAAVNHAKRRIAQKTPVKDVMTRDVIAVGKKATLQEVARLLSENRVSGMPVVDEDRRVIGVVSEADVLHTAGVKKGHTFKDILRHLLGEPLPRRGKGDRAEDIMTTPAVTTTPEADIREVAKILDEKRIKRLPVVDNEEKLVGIISRANLVKFMGGG
jgi:CBS domain-containing membrane protein